MTEAPVEAPVAAIDCGTNSIRLLITTGGREVVRLMRIVRLGQGVDRTGRLDPQAIERTRVALAAYQEQIELHGVKRVRMVATSATRDAANAGDFQEMVLATIGQPAEVIDGYQEAALSYSGAVAGLPHGDYVVVDIGGGSTEFVRGSGLSVVKSISIDIGCVRMTERHLHSDPPSPAELAALDEDIEDVISKGISFIGTQSARLVGLAGSVTTVAALALNLVDYDPDRVHHSVLTAQEVAGIADRLSTMDHAGRAELKVIHPGRVDVIVAGARILRQIMRSSGFTEVIVSEHDILDGIASSIRQPQSP